MDGLIVINKEADITSQGVVSRVKKILNEKKVGHIGTLDPMAEGVLPVLIGNYTKISKYLIEHDKTYVATIKFGIKTDTADSEGDVIEEKEVNIENITKEDFNIILKSFLGDSMQYPPKYSAIKINGKKLYEYARNNVEIEILPRKIVIYDIEALNVDNVQNELTFKVSCSKGTYIRTLCEDISSKINTVRIYEKIKQNKSRYF